MVVFSAKSQDVLQSICTVMATGILGRTQRDFCDAMSWYWAADSKTRGSQVLT